MTVKPDEIALRAKVGAADGKACAAWEASEALRMHPKRLNAILEKWYGKGWWEFGVSLRSGWLTADGQLALAQEPS